MSWQLVAEVVAYLHTADADSLTPTDRAVLLLIAQRAHDQTREAWTRHRDDDGRDLERHDPRRWDLGELSGLGQIGLRKALQRLAAAGVELRMVVGKGSDGRPMYARRGMQVTYRLPTLTLRSDSARNPRDLPSGTLGDPTGPPKAELGDPTGSLGDPTGSLGGPQVSPHGLRNSKKGQQSPRARPDAIAPICAALGCDENLALKIIKQIESEDEIRDLARYLDKFADDDQRRNYLQPYADDFRRMEDDEALRLGWRCKNCGCRCRTDWTVCRRCATRKGESFPPEQPAKSPEEQLERERLMQRIAEIRRADPTLGPRQIGERIRREDEQTTLTEETL